MQHSSVSTSCLRTDPSFGGKSKITKTKQISIIKWGKGELDYFTSLKLKNSWFWYCDL